MQPFFLPSFKRALLVSSLSVATLSTFTACNKERLGPDISGVYTGQVVARRPIIGLAPARGTISGSSDDVTVKQLESGNAVEISNGNFQTFTISNIRVDGRLWVRTEEDGNSFSYDGDDKLRTISFNWTSPTPDGPQTVTFGGARKRKKN